VGRDEIRLDAMRGEVVRDADGPFGRQVEVVRNPLRLKLYLLRSVGLALIVGPLPLKDCEVALGPAQALQLKP
jgi:hypothetical protein